MQRCLSSICSVLKVSSASDADIVAIVDPNTDVGLRKTLEAKGVFVKAVPSLTWNPANARKRRAPRRLYSFAKFHAWRFTQFRRIFWFDSDVVFFDNPSQIVDKYSSDPQDFVVAAFPQTPPGWSRNDTYINSGVMLFRPSLAVYSGLIRKWMDGRYKPWEGKETEQDVLCFAWDLLGRLIKMDICYNNRHYKWQAKCPPSILGHGWGREKVKACKIQNVGRSPPTTR